MNKPGTTSFQSAYLTLLRRQVDEEIHYLVQNGHNNDKIYVPCMFCVQRKDGHYNCYRLNELRQFQSSIISNQTSKLRPQHERKRIGFDIEHSSSSSPNSESFSFGSNIEKLPLLNPF